MLFLVLVMTLTSSVAGTSYSEPTDVSRELDSLLIMTRHVVNSTHANNVSIPDLSDSSGPVLKGITLGNLGTIYRTGKAFIKSVDPTTAYAMFEVGLGEKEVFVDDCPLVQGSLVLDLDEFSGKVLVYFTLNPDYTCSTVYKEVEVTRMGVGHVHSSNPEIDGLPFPRHMRKLLIAHINEWLNQKPNLLVLKEKADFCNVFMQ